MAEPSSESWCKNFCKVLCVVILVVAITVSVNVAIIFVIQSKQIQTQNQSQTDQKYTQVIEQIKNDSFQRSASVEIDTVESIILEIEREVITATSNSLSWGTAFKRRTRCNQTLKEEKETRTKITINQLSDTIILDCPLNSKQNDAGGKGHDLDVLNTLVKIKARLGEPGVDRSSIKIWLKYGDVGQDEMNITLCNELATSGHALFSDNFVGILGNHSGVMEPAIQDKRNGVRHQEFLERQQVWGEEYLKFVNEFRSKGLKYGFMLEPDSCFRFPSLVPKTVVINIKLFFAQKAHVYAAFRDNFPMCVDWDIYDECKDFLKARVPGVGSLKRVSEIDYMSFEEFIDILQI